MHGHPTGYDDQTGEPTWFEEDSYPEPETWREFDHYGS